MFGRDLWRPSYATDTVCSDFCGGGDDDEHQRDANDDTTNIIALQNRIVD